MNIITIFSCLCPVATEAHDEYYISYNTWIFISLSSQEKIYYRKRNRTPFHDLGLYWLISRILEKRYCDTATKQVFERCRIFQRRSLSNSGQTIDSIQQCPDSLCIGCSLFHDYPLFTLDVLVIKIQLVWWIQNGERLRV